VTTTLALFNVTLPAFISMAAAPTSGFIFDQVNGYCLYVFGAIGAATAWLVMKALVRERVTRNAS
jgi:uncharacterized membrane protein YdjX (TVP38/TMEM64 family)